MKKKPIDYRPRVEREKEEEMVLVFQPCIVCGKVIGEGYYARWGIGGVCKKDCNTIMESRPLYPDYQTKENP